MLPLKEIIHRIVEAPGYYYEAFFCPVKRSTIYNAWSLTFLGFSWTLDRIGTVLLYIAPLWGIACKLMAGLTLTGNFVMTFMSLAKRIRDWRRDESEEGKIKPNKSA